MDQIQVVTQQPLVEDSSPELQEAEQEWIKNFFENVVPQALLKDGKSGDNFVSPTQAECDRLATQILQSDDVQPVDNQGATSYTVKSAKRNKIVQFRLHRLEDSALSLARKTYGEFVAQPHYHAGFALPVYVAQLLPGQIHILQTFPKDRFPIERQTKTVQDVARFIAKGAFQTDTPIQSPYGINSWTRNAEALLRTIHKNEKLGTIEPRFAQRAVSLVSRLNLLDRLPPVITNPDFAEINIMVDQRTGALTGVLDFQDAQIEAFGMCIWGVYESFFGEMSDGKWRWFDQPNPESESDTKSTKLVCQVLHKRFWEAFWLAVPKDFSRDKYEDAVHVAMEVGMINRYFVRGLQRTYDGDNGDHIRGVEWARGVWLGRDLLDNLSF